MTFITTTGSGIARADCDADGTWTVQHGLPGVDVRCLAADPLPPGTVYAGTDGQGVLRSDDRGETWMPAGLPDQRIQATRRILEARPQTGIVMLTMLEDNDSLFAAMCAGARGYILKGADGAEVLATIRDVAEGRATFGPAITARLTGFFRQIESTPRHADIVFPELTDREREVLDLIAQGFNNQQIADALVISSKTVSNHISNIFNKLQVVDRAQAIIKAREAGLGRDQ